jgi:ATP:ADP antiporter, AAA family
MSTSAVDGVDAARPALSKGWLERLLSPIADVRRSETTSVLLLTLTMFLVLAGYYLLKTAREVFILSEGGAEVKSYSSAGQALMLLVLVPAYGAFASRVNRTRLVQWVTLFFASNLLVFLALLGAGFRVGIAFFLWLGIFNVMVIAQFWAFAADLFSEEQGKRLFPLIGVGSSLGAWLGSVRAGQLVDAGAPRLLAGGAGVLVVCAGLAGVISRVHKGGSPRQSEEAERKLAPGPNGFRMLFSDRYLALIAALVLLLNVVNSSGEYLFGRYVVNAAAAMYGAGPEGAAARQQFIGETYSRFFSYVNLTGFLLQMFVVSRVFKFLGVARALLIHPIVALIGYIGMLRAPSFEFIRWLKIADNSLDYSLGNTTKQALWLPTSREAKYKAKQAVDGFCVRAGDVLQAAVVYSGELASFTITAFAALNLVFVLGWLAVVRGLHQKLHARATTSGQIEM